MFGFDFSVLNDDEFEELCKELMIREGFQNVKRLSGPGSGDQGRDIHAEEILNSVTGTILPTKILAQCKNYGPSETTIGPTLVEQLANRARTLDYQRILIITSHELSSPAKAIAQGMATNPNWGIIAEWWNKYDLAKRIFKNPDIRRRFGLTMTPPSQSRIAILDGYANNRTTEKPCIPAYTNVPTKEWGELLQCSNFSLDFISASEINEEFDAILNPFGETYPEEDPKAMKTYRRILNYISNGGLFVNVAGFPFFYYWNNEEGRNIAHAPTRYVLNPETKIINAFWVFDETPLYRDFRITLDPRGPTKVEIFQEDQDKKIVGDLSELGIKTVTQFRAVISGNPKVIPLIRAEEGRIYPIATIRHGLGFLMVSGLELSPNEAPLVSNSLINWLLTSGGQIKQS